MSEHPKIDGNAGEVVLQGVGLHKKYGTIVAVEDVDLEIRAGEITAIVGDNGAGKSTLVKMLCGAIRPDGGEIYVGGKQVSLRNPLMAREAGIEVVFQDLALAPNRDVVANIFLGREPVRTGMWKPFGVLDRREMRQRARDQLASLEVNVPRLSGVPIAHLSGGQRQAVAVARAAFWATKAMLMDEPTAALGVEEQQKVAGLIEEVRKNGVPVLLISHNIPQVHEICDRIVVLLHGRVVADLHKHEADVEEIVMWITGAALARGKEGFDGTGANGH